jgi:hypothetical protein
MNKDFLLSHLSEALEQLTAMIENIKSDPEYEIGEFKVEISHVYHHLNTSWNGRDCTDEQWRTNENFASWRRFPDESNLFL